MGFLSSMGNGAIAARHWRRVLAVIAQGVLLGVLLVRAPLAAAWVFPDYAERQQNYKGQAYFADENIWIYNAAFAERFRMPPEWVSKDLYGVEAAAFRVIPGWLDCGLAGKKENCRRADFCHTDVYVDEAKHPLPWGTEKQADWRAIHESARWISDKGAPEPLLPILYPWKHPKTGKSMVYYDNSGHPNGNPTYLRAYQRRISGSLTLLSFEYRCLSHSPTPPTRFVLVEDAFGRDIKYPMKGPNFHEFRLSLAFEKRIDERLAIRGKENETLYKKLLGVR